MGVVLGSKVNPKRAAAVQAGLTPWLEADEEVRLMVRANRVNPLIDLVVVTDRRVLGVGSFDVAERGPKLQLTLAEVTCWQVRMTLLDPRRLCVTTAAAEVAFGNLDRADVSAVATALAGVRARVGG